MFLNIPNSFYQIQIWSTNDAKNEKIAREKIIRPREWLKKQRGPTFEEKICFSQRNLNFLDIKIIYLLS